MTYVPGQFDGRYTSMKSPVVIPTGISQGPIKDDTKIHYGDDHRVFYDRDCLWTEAAIVDVEVEPKPREYRGGYGAGVVRLRL